MKEQTVPVMVDSRKEIGQFLMTRVAYYYVETLRPSLDIPTDPSSLGIPVLPLEFSGAIHKPIGEGEFFETPEQVEQVFQAVEHYDTLYVSSDNVWIPNRLFDKTPERSDIYRVPFELFARMYLICRNNAVPDADDSRYGDERAQVWFSAIETKAFALWAAGITQDVIAAYPKDERLKLRWRG